MGIGLRGHNGRGTDPRPRHGARACSYERLSAPGPIGLCLLSGCLLTAAAISGCRHGRDEASGTDATRIGATALELDAISDDSVNAPEGDATDWRYVEIAQPGVLTVQLHWDDAKSSLLLELYDAVGKQVASGEVWQQQGRQVVFEAPEKGRYYFRVAAQGDHDSTPYSVKATFQKKLSSKCHNCTVGQKTCVGKDAFAVCGQTKEGCNAWGDIGTCASDQSCREGQCVSGCLDQCKADERRCAGPESSQICVRSEGGCLQWGAPVLCESNMTCDGGRCKKPKEPRVAKKESRPASAEAYVQGRIISMYTKDGRRTLHIEIGDNKEVQPGMAGFVVEGDTGQPLPKGEFKVKQVTGGYCIAETNLEALGNNRTVKIKVK